jgi:2-methylisocitrate lyase-like PEP mutase family enzyme
MTGPALREAFRALHDSGTFVLPNPWDAGSARLLATMGFPAVATTSAGLAWTLGRLDGTVTRDELAAHVESLVAAVPVPVAVDAEHGFAADAAGVADTVGLLAAAGASGVSIEDWNPATERVDDVAVSVERVGVAAEACRRSGVVLTARCENHLHGVDDLDDTVARLRAYRSAGADVVYAPGLTRPEDIARVVTETAAPVNVLAVAGGPSVAELAALGVRRVSTGSGLASAAYGALVQGAQELLGTGTYRYLGGALPPDLRRRALSLR